MLRILMNYSGTDNQRREAVHSGAICLHNGSVASRALCDFAKGMVSEAFEGLDPEHAQEILSVDKFIEIIAPLKSRFTNSPKTKELLREYLISMGVDPKSTYFDVPRLRVVPHSDYLSSGVSYAYKAHRDIWYSSPAAQINWWLPVWDVTPERTMAFYPSYWDRAIQNTSGDFDYGEWVKFGRPAATSQTTQDTRKHPLPMQSVSADDEFRYGAGSGDAIIFSACHLHATVPNTSSATRYSTDFRTINIDDLRGGRGGPNVDCRAKGSTLGDFLRVDDLAPIKLTSNLEAL